MSKILFAVCADRCGYPTIASKQEWYPMSRRANVEA